jgi:hypothetical protein
VLNVFELISATLEKILGHWRKGEGYAANVKEAIASLEKAISDFKRYAYIDMNKSLGRMEKRGARAEITADNTEKLATGTYDTVKETNVAVKETNVAVKELTDTVKGQ